MNKFYICCLLVLGLISSSYAGPLAYGICQTGCNALVVSCYAAAGFTFGTITAGAGLPAVLVSCNAGLGVCMAGCVAAGLSPTL
ncbi:zygote-specific protein [Mucor ambiguus]|uniref:Zygote-specific protein n=1 Tax=Mucor ambiguus TaxID=91626 RepID=A0A0C9N468_9FUNG|nr:zygote-specific protein [Mucor ambiguus]